MLSNDIISHHEMCGREGLSLQAGMNFRPSAPYSIVLSSHRPGAPYEDVISDDGRELIYEGHDIPKSSDIQNPKDHDQPLKSKTGKHTQNGLFHEAAQSFKRGKSPARHVRVYEKIKNGIWSYNGLFELVDSWVETKGPRHVFKFKLVAIKDFSASTARKIHQEALRVIPTHVKLAVWKRDGGACVQCGSKTELHFDHILPYSRGGTSNSAENVQLLCMRHNVSKGAKLL